MQNQLIDLDQKWITHLVEFGPGAVLVCFAWMQVEQQDRTLYLRFNSGTPDEIVGGTHQKGGLTVGSKEFVRYQRVSF